MLRSILAFLVQGLWADQLSIGAEPSVAAIQPAPVASGGASDNPTPSSGIECLAVRPAGVSAPDRQPLSCAARQAEDAVVQLTAGIAAKSNPFWTGTGIAGFLNAPRLTRQTAAEPIHAEDVLAAGDSHAGQVPATAGTGLTELESTVVPGIVPRTSKDRAAEAAALLLCIIAATEPAPPAVANLLVSAAVRQEEGQPELPPPSSVAYELTSSLRPLTAGETAPRRSLPGRLELVRASNRPFRASALPRRNAQRSMEALMRASQPVRSAASLNLPSADLPLPNTAPPVSQAAAA